MRPPEEADYACSGARALSAPNLLHAGEVVGAAEYTGASCLAGNGFEPDPRGWRGPGADERGGWSADRSDASVGIESFRRGAYPLEFQGDRRRPRRVAGAVEKSLWRWGDPAGLTLARIARWSASGSGDGGRAGWEDDGSIWSFVEYALVAGAGEVRWDMADSATVAV